MPVASANITHRRKRPLPAGAASPGAASPGAGPEPARGTPPAEAAFRSLLKTLGLLKRVMEPFFARFGISASQWGVLVTLHRSENQGRSALRLTDLGDRLIVRPASITGVVDRLQRMGLVARTASPRDHRAKDVNLTADGRELVCRVLERHPAQVHRALEGLSVPEQGELQRLLDHMTAHLEALPVDERSDGAATVRAVGSGGARTTGFGLARSGKGGARPCSASRKPVVLAPPEIAARR